MAYLNWISDEDLIEATKNLLDKAGMIKIAAEKNINKNVVDPFSSLFQIGGFGIGYEEWFIGEITRQAQKSLQNHVGDFHQNILGSVVGWDNKKTGSVIDLVNVDRMIIAEVKNKHNTVKGSDLVGVYDTLAEAVNRKMSVYKDFTAYYVTVIPPNTQRFNKPFTPSDNKKGQRREAIELVRAVDGASFYELVTGDHYALRNLFNILPTIITELTGKVFDNQEVRSLLSLFNGAYGTE
ncbi:Eco47II family restriction endonuclease [Sphingobacterium alkalisoli]|uniref:Eco47II family restriction endonuclease n=1 Tax=Sphingobacterium alkalisoli TaxID=1874115 RepID=A0A4U0H3T7_9SPHI|nr:Eco47II family restriction endonuclease [Sphingobacterium alkalisoli]TJY65824.1 Eco47II family restriction endonuclease [Sphingobacterium alkalisoli]GGH18092.1 type II restriction endonuclease [Sphingobacterium alkalisoli]